MKIKVELTNPVEDFYWAITTIARYWGSNDGPVELSYKDLDKAKAVIEAVFEKLGVKA